MAVKHSNDERAKELLDATEKAEGCPHIHMIEGWAQPFNDMLFLLHREGGIAWQNGDGNALWYHHAQESFRPLSLTKGYRNYHILAVPPTEAGKGSCDLCDTARGQRSSPP
jgi:hypothetical protein